MMAGNGSKGSAAIEFAMLLPLVLYLFFGMLEYGWFLTNQIVLTSAVADGARSAVKAKEWEGEDPAEIARAVVRNGFWPFELEDDFIKAGEVEDGEEDLPYLPRRFEVEVASIEFPALTGYLPESWVPQTLSARTVMVFP